MTQKSIAIIGGGVVGICCAMSLIRQGHRVSVIEPDEITNSTAMASCGSIATSEVLALSKPGILLRAPGWLLDSEGPLSIQMSSVWRTLPWFMRFARNSTPNRLQRIATSLAPLTLRAIDDFEELFSDFDLQGLIGDRPMIELFETDAEIARERSSLRLKREMGFAMTEIQAADLADLEPAVSKRFKHGVICEDWRSIQDSRQFLTSLVRAFLSAGGRMVRGRAIGWGRDGSVVNSVFLDGGEEVLADHFVLSAGIWSKPLAQKLGITLPMTSVKGYQALISNPSVSVRHALTHAKGGFGITPFLSGLSIAGTIEFSTLGSRESLARAQLLLRKAPQVLPELNIEEAAFRSGMRPLTTDTLPIIGGAPGVSNLVLATGHGQLGVTLAATTGKMVADALSRGDVPDWHKATAFPRPTI